MGHELNKNETPHSGITYHQGQVPTQRRMESKTFQEGTLQEERMTASNKEALVQELFKEVKAQGEIIEKIISHPSKMKEEELMEPAHDKEEGEEWDEEDKADYERNKLT